MSFAVHYFVSGRKSNNSYATKHPGVIKANALAMVSRNVTAVLIERPDELATMKERTALVALMDRRKVLDHDTYRGLAKRRRLINDEIGRMIERGDILIGQTGLFWLPSQIDKDTVLAQLAEAVEQAPVPSAKERAIAHQAEQYRRAIENGTHPSSLGALALA